MRILITSALLLFAAWAPAQDDLGPRAPVVKMAPAPLLTVRQGKGITVPLSFRVASGYHINSNQPKSEFLIPTVLKVDPITDIPIGNITYPEGPHMRLPFAPDKTLNPLTLHFTPHLLLRPLH